MNFIITLDSAPGEVTFIVPFFTCWEELEQREEEREPITIDWDMVKSMIKREPAKTIIDEELSKTNWDIDTWRHLESTCPQDEQSASKREYLHAFINESEPQTSEDKTGATIEMKDQAFEIMYRLRRQFNGRAVITTYNGVAYMLT